MNPKEMERQTHVQEVFGEIQDVMKEYKSLPWKRLDEKKLVRKVIQVSEKFLEKRELAESTPVEEPVSTVPTLEVPEVVPEEEPIAYTKEVESELDRVIREIDEIKFDEDDDDDDDDDGWQ